MLIFKIYKIIYFKSITGQIWLLGCEFEIVKERLLAQRDKCSEETESRGLWGPRGGSPNSVWSVHSFGEYLLPFYNVQSSVLNAGDS